MDYHRNYSIYALILINFKTFQTDEESVDTMHKLNGKPIPGTFPVVRFRLNTASREARANMQQEREFSVWVGDLSPEVDDYSLYRVFASKYSSIKTAKGTHRIKIICSPNYLKNCTSHGFLTLHPDVANHYLLQINSIKKTWNKYVIKINCSKRYLLQNNIMRLK